MVLRIVRHYGHSEHVRLHILGEADQCFMAKSRLISDSASDIEYFRATFLRLSSSRNLHIETPAIFDDLSNDALSLT